MPAIVHYTPTVWITPKAMAKLQTYILAVDYEISGFGSVGRIGNDLLVEEIMLITQKSGPGHTDLDIDQMFQFWFEYEDAGLDPEKMRLWWHSHAKMTTFWSGTDEGTAWRFGTSTKADWWLSIVGNHFGSFRVRLDLYRPFRATIDDMPLKVYLPVTQRMQQEIAEEVKQKVTYVEPPKVVPQGNGKWRPGPKIKPVNTTTGGESNGNS